MVWKLKKEWKYLKYGKTKQNKNENEKKYKNRRKKNKKKIQYTRRKPINAYTINYKYRATTMSKNGNAFGLYWRYN